MNNNRFLYLEKELTVFAENPKKYATKHSKAKGYSTQKNPALAGAVIAGAGLGWKIFEFAWSQTEGDIKVKLARLEGAKYPYDKKDDYHNKAAWKRKRKTVYSKVTNHLGDEISSKFDLNFKYNGYGVGYIEIDHSNSNDAVGWGLDVEAKIMVDPNQYTSRNGGQEMAMIDVTFNYRFSRSLGSDIIKIKRYSLYGDGTVIAR